MAAAGFGVFFSRLIDTVHVSPSPSEHLVYFHTLYGSVMGENGEAGVSFLREVTIPGSLNPPDSINFASQYAHDDVHLMTRVDVTRLPDRSLQFVGLRRGLDDAFHQVDQTSVELSGRLQVEFRTYRNYRKVPVNTDQLGHPVGNLILGVELRRKGHKHLDQGPFAPDSGTIAHVATSGAYGSHREKWVVRVEDLADHLHNEVQFREHLAMVAPFLKDTVSKSGFRNVLFTVGPQTYRLHPTPDSQTKTWGIYPYATRIF